MIALDTNVLIYSVLAQDASGRHFKALEIIERIASVGGIVPLQVIGEFLNVCKQKKVVAPQLAAKRANEFLEGFDSPQTQDSDLFKALDIADRKMLQYFDALIIGVASRVGAKFLLSEDMHDGLEIEGLTIVNPFAAANETLLADYFGSAL